MTPATAAGSLYASGWPPLLLSIYLLYMFRHFQTTFRVQHPLEPAMQRRLGDVFRHPLDGSATYGSQICPFGQCAIVGLVAFLWARYCGVARSLFAPATVRAASLGVLACTAAISLLNMNAVLYLAPYFVFEATAAAR